MIFALFFTHAVDAIITLKKVNEAIIQININGYKINFYETGINISNEGSHVKIESISAKKIRISKEFNGTTYFYIGNNVYPIRNPYLFSEDKKILMIFECQEEARKYQNNLQKNQSKKRNIAPSQKEPPAKRSLSCGSTMSNSNFDIQKHCLMQLNTGVHIPTLPHFPIQQQNHFNDPNIQTSRTARQLQWHSEAVAPDKHPFHNDTPQISQQLRTIQQTEPLEFVPCTRAIKLYQEQGTPLYFQTYYPSTYPSVGSQKLYPITQNQPPLKNTHSSPQPNLPIQPRNTPPLA
jgi:hypothetical protein